MKRLLTILSIFIVAFCILPTIPKGRHSAFYIQADELSDIEKQLGDLQHALELPIAATTPLEKNFDALKAQLNDSQNRISALEKDIVKKEKEVKAGEENLAAQQD